MWPACPPSPSWPPSLSSVPLQCAHASMETLTLARFVCELTLQEYDFVQERPSHLAASCLLLALKMKNLNGWVSATPPPRGHAAGGRGGACVSGLGGWEVPPCGPRSRHCGEFRPLAAAVRPFCH